jgi:hypothetical protein
MNDLPGMLHRRSFRTGRDATVIDLCAEMFPWATFRRTKGAVKLHFTLDHDGYLPTALVITEGKRHEVTVARQQAFAAGTILILDRGYVDFGWFARLTEAGVFFVTRLKDGTAYDVVKRHPVPSVGGVVADEWIALRSPQSAAKYEPGQPLRRVAVVLPDGDRLVFLTNHLDLGPTTIARIYKDRWQIELFFEISTWCTPSDAMGFQGVTERTGPLVGSMDGFGRPHIARRPQCAESRGRPRTPVWPPRVSIESTARRWSVSRRGRRRRRSRTVLRELAVLPHGTPQSHGGFAGSRHASPSSSVRVRCAVDCD